MKESDWFGLLYNPRGRLIRVLPKLFKHLPQFGSSSAWYPKGQIVFMLSLDGWEEQLSAINDESKRLDEFYTTTFVTGSGAGGDRSASFIVMLDGRLVKIGLTIHDIEFVGDAEE